MQNFKTFGLDTVLLDTLTRHQFITPTQIQAEAIPVALEGRDIIGTAQTGTGKTGAFGIPLISHLLKNKQDGALVMAPTRELAVQVMDMLQKMLGSNNDIRTILIVGGESISNQMRKLKTQKQLLIIGTPGRINDHLQRDSIKLNKTRFLVLDETDRMLDMGFSVTIDQILSRLPQDRQTLMFSATMPGNILKLSKRYLTDPVHIAIEHVQSISNLIKQETVQLAESEKYEYLLAQLEQRTGSIIVFVKTKINAEKMAKKLHVLRHSVSAIHGDLKQSQRRRVIKAFRDRENRIMIATDVAARGLDIPHIEHVINYDLPHCAEDYIHRIGRTGRAGAKGSALNLVAPQDSKKWYAISRLMNPNEKPVKVIENKKPYNKNNKPFRKFVKKA